MKFTLTAAALHGMLERVASAIPAKPPIPVLECLHVDVEHNKATFTATDTGVTISYELECETEGKPTVFLIPFHQLNKIVALQAGAITIECDRGHVVWVISEYDRFCLGKSEDVKDFPSIPSVADKNKFEINGTFIPSLCMAALGVSKDAQRPAMTCVCVEISKDIVGVISTDGHTVYTRFIAVTLDIEEPARLLVPAVVSKVLDGFTAAKIGFNTRHMSFEAGPVRICAKRGDGEFPQYKTVMPVHHGNLTVTLSEMEKALAKALIVTSSIDYNGIDAHIYNDRVELKTEIVDTGMSANCKVVAEAPECLTERLRFNGRLLKRSLKQLAGHGSDDAKIVFSIQGANKGVSIRLEGQSDLTCLIMPITLN